MRRGVSLAVVFFAASLAFAGPDTISYQGSLLTPGGTAVPDGTYRMQFTLYDAAAAGTNRWQQTQNVSVTAGLFSTTLGDVTPFGGVFTAYPGLWLAVAVDLDHSNTFQANEVFSPRQVVSGAAWSIPRLESHSTCPNLIGGYNGNTIAAGVFGATIGGGGRVTGVNRVTDNYGTVGGGEGNQAGDGAGATGDRAWASVGGGLLNIASGDSATVGGGDSNIASGIVSSVGGGRANKAGDQAATVAGGWSNTAGGNASAILGGANNFSSGPYSVVCGGGRNSAQGGNAMVVGGDLCEANGNFSFASGRRAKANAHGSFVWADSTDADFVSNVDNQFRVRATGGIYFFSGSGNGPYCPPNGTDFLPYSNRDAKENFEEVDTKQILDKVAALPITKWNFRFQEDSWRHIGPMAQDFYDAFGVGFDNLHLSNADSNGVALAAIQGLYKMVKDKDAEIAALRADAIAQASAHQRQLAEQQEQLSTQQQQLNDLIRRLAAVESARPAVR